MYKIIKILNKFQAIANVGKVDGVAIGDEFNIISHGIEIDIDGEMIPFTKNKATVKVEAISDNYCVLSKEKYKKVNILEQSTSFTDSFYKTSKKPDSELVLNDEYTDETINFDNINKIEIGDKVEFKT